MRPHVIILEGPDGAGKTTLADCLQQLTAYDNTHLSAPVNESAYDLCKRHVGEVLSTGRSTIFDRLHLSEPIYGPIARGHDSMGREGIIRIESTLWVETYPIVVLCLPPYENARFNWSKRNEEKREMITGAAEYNYVYGGYKMLPLATTLPVLHYDYTQHRVEDLLFRLRQTGIVL